MPKHDIHVKAENGEAISTAELVAYLDARTTAARHWVLGVGGTVVTVLIALFIAVFGAIADNSRALQEHKERAGIHRTPEEAAAQLRADAEWKQYVKESLARIEQRLDKAGK